MLYFLILAPLLCLSGSVRISWLYPDEFGLDLKKEMKTILC